MTTKASSTEELVELAYRGVAPSPEVEEELLDSLPAERALPRARLGWRLAAPLAAAGLLAAIFLWPRLDPGAPAAPGDAKVTSAQANRDEPAPPEEEPIEEEEEEEEEENSVPVEDVKEEPIEEESLEEEAPEEIVIEEPIRAGPRYPATVTKESVEIRIVDGGRILIQPRDLGGEWAQVSLDGLGKFLQASAAAHDARMLKQGKSGYDAGPGKVMVSRLNVNVRASKRTPWRHVQWVMMICAEQKMPRVRFMLDDAPVDAALPMDPGLRSEGAKAPREVRIVVRIVRREDGKTFAYRLAAGKEVADLKDVARWIADGRRAATADKATVYGEIRASSDTPHGLVAALLDRFHAEGVEHVQFYGTTPPDKAERGSPNLADPMRRR